VAGLPAKIVSIHRAFDRRQIPHAFGGALALAWCTGRARGTIDIDVNAFVDASEAATVLESLPRGVAWDERDRQLVERDGQARLWWDTTPVDLFLNTTDFHRQAALRSRREEFAGAEVPFLSCLDLAVFKAFFNRRKDWADLEEMVAAGTLDVDRTVGILSRYLGPTDERIGLLRELASTGA
jgi:hypothetical protein